VAPSPSLLLLGGVNLVRYRGVLVEAGDVEVEEAITRALA
jgi:hypothetical protein